MKDKEFIVIYVTWETIKCSKEECLKLIHNDKVSVYQIINCIMRLEEWSKETYEVVYVANVSLSRMP